MIKRSFKDLRMNIEKSHTILIAEDNESNFLLLVEILKKNYRIIHAVNGIEAIQMYKNDKPDAILMDIKMPQMDGLTATRNIRQFDPDIPIIVVSANAYEHDKQIAYQAGCNAYIMKPINFKELKDALSLLLAPHEHI